jgi:hypothetical protein
MDPLRFLEERDSLKRAVMMQISKDVFEARRIQDQNRAVLIATEVGKLFGGS